MIADSASGRAAWGAPAAGRISSGFSFLVERGSRHSTCHEFDDAGDRGIERRAGERKTPVTAFIVFGSRPSTANTTSPA